jgi:hypothetical protein
MAKAGSKGSRSERKAGRQRAERARAHGLPEGTLPQHGARGAGGALEDVGDPADVTDAAPHATSVAGKRARASEARRPPVLVWVVGGALALLAIAYVLTRFRDAPH